MFHWDPKPEIFTIPYLNWPILWYGFLFALGFAIGFPLFVSILVRYFRLRSNLSAASLRRSALALTDRLTVYLVIATIVGARLGHFLFYESPADYLNDPLEILRIWRGGLASHGAVIAILAALALFCRRIRAQSSDWSFELIRDLTWLRLLDFVAIPTAFVACCIRIGNFFNQEILGTPTNLPWAVVFGHPADHTLPAPRHPVQLYEALFYLATFGLLLSLSYRPKILLAKGKLIGLFLILVFGFRFAIEFLKVEQSHLLTSSPLTMGQILSVPVVILGLIFLFRRPSHSK